MFSLGQIWNKPKEKYKYISVRKIESPKNSESKKNLVIKNFGPKKFGFEKHVRSKKKCVRGRLCTNKV